MKILLVDDSKSSRYALRLELQRNGAEVETAESAEDAFELLQGNLPDAILMDHMMPGLNGIEALERLRADPRTAGIPVVMCTTEDDTDFAAVARERGAVGILPKSDAADKLPELLNRLRAGFDRRAPPAAPTTPALLPAAAEQGPNPELARWIEVHTSALIEARIESRLIALVEPLLRELEHSLSERLSAASRELIEGRVTELWGLLEARVATEREAAGAVRAHDRGRDLESAAGRLVRETLPDLVKAEIEVERGQVMDLVDQCLREFAARGAVKEEQGEERPAALDGAIVAKAKEVARREAADAAEGAVARAQRIADNMMRQVRTSLMFVYLAVLVAALIGILAAAASYFLRY